MTKEIEQELMEEVQYLREQNKPENAISICKTILEYSPNNTRVLFELGDTYRGKECYREAIVYFKKASAIQEDHYIIHLSRMTLSSCYTFLAEQENNPEYKKSSKALRRKANEQLINFLGDAMDDFGMKKEKRITKKKDPYAKVLEEFEVYSWYCDMLIESYIIEEEHKEAKFYCLTLLEKVPNDPFYNCLLGDIYKSLHEYKEAMAAYERALFFETDETMKPAIWNSLAYAYIGTGREKEALEYVQKAIEGDPENINYMDSLAEIYAKMNEYDKALTCYQKVASIDETFNHVKETIKQIENRSKMLAA